MKKSTFFILSGLCSVLMSAGSVYANTDKTKTELRDAIYTNCVKDIKNNKKVSSNVASSSALQASVCSCVADNTIKSIDSTTLNAFATGGWGSYQESIKGKTEIAKISDTCLSKSSELNTNVITKEMFDKYIKKMQESKKTGTSDKTNSAFSNEAFLKMFKENSGKVSLKELLKKRAEQK